MSKEELIRKMQGIEFVLFMLQSQSHLREGEIEAAHRDSREILKMLRKEEEINE